MQYAEKKIHNTVTNLCLEVSLRSAANEKVLETLNTKTTTTTFVLCSHWEPVPTSKKHNMKYQGMFVTCCGHESAATSANRQWIACKYSQIHVHLMSTTTDYFCSVSGRKLQSCKYRGCPGPKYATVFRARAGLTMTKFDQTIARSHR